MKKYRLEYKLKLDIHKQIAYCELMINNRYNLLVKSYTRIKMIVQQLYKILFDI